MKSKSKEANVEVILHLAFEKETSSRNNRDSPEPLFLEGEQGTLGQVAICLLHLAKTSHCFLFILTVNLRSNQTDRFWFDPKRESNLNVFVSIIDALSTQTTY